MDSWFIFILVLLFILSAIFVPIIAVRVYGNNKAKRDAAKRLEIQQQEASKCELRLAQEGFKVSKALHFDKNHFAIDTTNNKVNISSATESRTFAFKDLVAFEMVEDGQIYTSSSTGNAVAGALLFGAAGAIVGGTTSKSTNACTNMQLRVSVNDMLNPSIVLQLVSSPGFIKNGPSYTKAFNFAKEACSTLAVIQKQ